MSVTKYDVLAKLIDTMAREEGGDPYGWHHILVGVVNEISVGHESEDELADAIYELIAGALLPDKEDEVEDQVDKT